MNRSLATKELFFGCILMFFGYMQQLYEPTKNENRPGPGLDGKILNSTVQIRVYSQDSACYSLSLGTVFMIDERQYILTHNHWSILSSDSIVVFYDWQKTLLLEISGQEFLDLILYRDAGSLILQAPDHLKPYGFPLVKNQGLSKDDRLRVVLINPEETGELKVADARLLAYIEGKFPGFAITPLFGEMVASGDSGAGIWHEDQLLGNMWSVVLRDPPVKEWEHYQVSYVARFPDSLGNPVGRIQPISTMSDR